MSSPSSPIRERILIVDDEDSLRASISEFLEEQGLQVMQASSCTGAMAAFRRVRPDAVILDYALPDGTALDLLAQLRGVGGQSIPAVVLTGHGSIDLAVRAVKLGAEQFLTKPVELAALRVVLERALDNQRNRQKQLAGNNRQDRDRVQPFRGSSGLIQTLASNATKVAAADCPVLILGETGSGKGVLARWLHSNGARAKEAFVDVNCASFARDLLETELFGHEKGAFTGAINTRQGLFEVAHRGTIFLDEIGDMDLQLQPKLLKVLEERTFRRVGHVRDHQVDTRVIAATHQDLMRLATEKKFRADLLYRINTVVLRVPPLRERLEDLEELVDEILRTLTSDLGRPIMRVNSDGLSALRSYSWPGNIRELRNVLERAALLSDGETLAARHFRFDHEPQTKPASYNSHVTLEELETQHIEHVVAEENGHVDRAAMRLGISRSTLYQKLKTLRARQVS